MTKDNAKVVRMDYSRFIISQARGDSPYLEAIKKADLTISSLETI
jgi:hypothetical protein